ncbi:MAG: TetR family transcriptional regulator [Actinobacteria bacterium]|nr:TetR family transcriptional regulator [Actinomycetota bacterium]
MGVAAMTKRGDETRARLIAATKDVVREVGYAHATTKAIAGAAGVAEGTIYRHFPDKVALFFSAALSGSQALIEELATLPELAGSATVDENLEHALARLLVLRQDLLPLELALNSDPEIARRRQAMDAPDIVPGLPSPPEAISRYLDAEASLGRVRADVDSRQVSLLLLSALFGLMLAPGTDPSSPHPASAQIGPLVHLVLDGIRGSGSSRA